MVDTIQSIGTGDDDEGACQLNTGLIRRAADFRIEQAHSGLGLPEQPVVWVRGVIQLHNWRASIQIGR